MESMIPEFVTYLEQEKNASASTVMSYQRDLKKLFNFLQSKGIESLEEVTPTSLNSYILFLEREGFSTATVSRNVASMKSYFHFALVQKQVERDPSELIKAPHIDKKAPEILTQKEVGNLLNAPLCETAKGCRDKAMLELLYATGIRVSELIDLNIKDVNLRSGVLYCRGNKGVRPIPMYPSAVVAVSDYIYRMRGLITGPESGNALFVNLSGGRLTRQGFWKIVKGYALEAGIQKEITPHTLRHSFALHLLENGASVKDIQTMMGHADISSTQVYVQLLDNHVKQVYQDCHPKAKIG